MMSLNNYISVLVCLSQRQAHCDLSENVNLYSSPRSFYSSINIQFGEDVVNHLIILNVPISEHETYAGLVARQP